MAGNGNGHVMSPFAGVVDPMVVNRLERVVRNAIYSRSRQWSRGEADPRRDIDDECGLPKTRELNAAVYRDLYDREAIGARVVELMPSECWQVHPNVFETEDIENTTAFEEAWDGLDAQLRGGSWYQDGGSPIWEVLERIDKLSGIGRYGIVLIGLDDGKELSEPASGIDEKGRPAATRPRTDILYLRVFDESSARVSKRETDRTNPRYGQPTEYLISLDDPNSEVLGEGGVRSSGVPVHWSRAFHVADVYHQASNSEWLAVPRLQPVYNNIYGLRKLYNASPEMYWYGAFPGLYFFTQPQLGGDVRVNKAGMKTEVEKMFSGLQRWMMTRGMDVKQLSPVVVDPTPQIKVQLEAICVKLNVPMRVFLGSERGELASSQDDKKWNKRLEHRNNSYTTPRIIVPFLDRMICLGCLPEPPEGYYVRWPALESLTEEEKAAVAERRTNAMAKYVAGNVNMIIDELNYMVEELGYDKNRAEEILETVLERMVEPEEPIEEEEGEIEIPQRSN